MVLQEQTTVLKCPDQPGPVQTPNAAPSFLSTHLRNVNRLDSPASPLHCHALHNQSRIPASPALHSRVHSPSISNMAALRYVYTWGKTYSCSFCAMYIVHSICKFYVGSRRFLCKNDSYTLLGQYKLIILNFFATSMH